MEYRALTRVDADKELEFSTRLFSGLWKEHYSQSGSDYSLRILDLGGVQSSSIDFFSLYSCYITIADAIESLAKFDPDIEDELDEQALEQAVKTRIQFEQQPYDLILGWDCFSHLPARIFPFVHAHLLQACHKNTYIHGFLYTSEKRYSQPGKFYILAEDKMACYENLSPPLRTRPMNSLMLMNKMPGFALQRSVLMRNGMQEFILRREK